MRRQSQTLFAFFILVNKRISMINEQIVEEENCQCFHNVDEFWIF